MNKISIITPCYNEEESIQLFYEEICRVTNNIADADMEIYFIDDGSKDNTCHKLQELHLRDERVKYISFSRNFGKEAAIFAGLRAVKGDCVVVMDVDLQHPPETIIEMYHLWRQGYEIVEGIKLNRGKESAGHRIMSDIFYALISKMIGIDMKDSSDFKLLDKKVVTELATLKEKDTFFRALSYWVGFKSVSVYYHVQERVAGQTKWSFIALMKYAVKNLIAFSYAPLYLIILIGSAFLLVGAGFAIDALISYFHGRAVGGYPTLVLLIILSSGGIMLSLGIVGIYIAKMYDQIKQRPQYIIREMKE